MNEELILSKLDGLKELFEEKFKHNDEAHCEVNEHLERLNGQVARNTKFRWQVLAYVPIATVFLSAIVSVVVYYLKFIQYA